MPRRTTLQRLADIAAAARTIVRIATGLDSRSLAASELVLGTVLYNLAVIGEAARHVPEGEQQRYAGLPWAEMVAMRNVVVHEYFRLSVEDIRDTIERDLPPLIAQIQKVLDVES